MDTDPVVPNAVPAQVRDAWAESKARGNADDKMKGQVPPPVRVQPKMPHSRDLFGDTTDTNSNNSAEKHRLFVSPEDMKKEVRAALFQKAYNVHDLYKKDGIYQFIARSQPFEYVTLGVIIMNSFWMWIDTDYNKSANMLEADIGFQVGEHFFCIYFSLEWCIRFGAFTDKRKGFTDGWFAFDSALVVLMVFETWAMTVVLLVTDDSSELGNLVNASILRLFRLLRLSRLTRLLRAMPELLILIKGMVSAARSVFFTLFLLVILLYIFAIALAQLTENNPVEDPETGGEMFGTIPSSMYTLMVTGIFLDNLTPVMNNISDVSPVCAGLFLLFIALAALMVMNMLIGVLCEVVSAVAASEKEEMDVFSVKAKMDNVLRTLDADNDKLISRAEFDKLITNHDAVVALHAVGVDAEVLVDFADFIFEPDDSEEEDEDGEPKSKTLTFEEFMNVVLEYRSTNNATVKHVQDMSKMLKTEFRKLDEKLGTRRIRGQKSIKNDQGERGEDGGMDRCSTTMIARQSESVPKGRNSASVGASSTNAMKAEALLFAAQAEVQALLGDSAGPRVGPQKTEKTFERLTSEEEVKAWAANMNNTLATSLRDLKALQDKRKTDLELK